LHNVLFLIVLIQIPKDKKQTERKEHINYAGVLLDVENVGSNSETA
jgi:hypothetical protein